MRISSDVSVQPTSGIEAQKQAKLVDAAQQFEATMLQELLKPMQVKRRATTQPPTR